MVTHHGYIIYKGYHLCRAWQTKMFFYGNLRLPAHITNYDMAEEFITKYLIPKMTELSLYKEPWDPWSGEWYNDFPLEHRAAIEDTIKKNWFYYKEK